MKLDRDKIEEIALSPITAISLAAIGLLVASFAYFGMKPPVEKPVRVIASAGPCDPKAIDRQKRLVEATKLMSQKKYRAAEEALNLLAVELPKASVVFSNLAYAQKKMRKFEIAEENLKKAIELEPGQWILHHNLGMLYFEKNDTTKSLEALKVAADLAPTNYQVHLSTARVQEQAGKFTDARLSYGKALSSGPDASTQELVKSRVKKLDVLAFIERGDK
jgi:tetratricopeptide (TPR) repeat protein